MGGPREALGSFARRCNYCAGSGWAVGHTESLASGDGLRDHAASVLSVADDGVGRGTVAAVRLADDNIRRESTELVAIGQPTPVADGRAAARVGR